MSFNSICEYSVQQLFTYLTWFVQISVIKYEMVIKLEEVPNGQLATSRNFAKTIKDFVNYTSFVAYNVLPHACRKKC